MSFKTISDEYSGAYREKYKNHYLCEYCWKVFPSKEKADAHEQKSHWNRLLEKKRGE